MARTMSIQNGPSKWDLLLSLAEFDPNFRKPVTFHVGEKTSSEIKLTITIQISGLEREGGLDEKWTFKGTQITGFRYVEGFYSSQTRRGYISFPDTE